MIFSISWKNIWRNKLRSLIVISAIILGLIGGVFSLAFQNGMIEQLIASTIDQQISHIQIHNKDFKINQDIQYGIDKSDSLISNIQKLESVKAVSGRILINAMASSANNGLGVTMIGVNPENEKHTTSIFSKITNGEYFTERKNSVVVGEKLLEKLSLKYKSKLILTFQNKNGDISSAAFKIVGVFKTNNSIYDQSTVFVKKNDLIKLIGLQNDYTNEIAIKLNASNLIDKVNSEIKTTVSNLKINNLQVENWNEIMPSLEVIKNYTVQFTFIFIIIILIALSFGIINTMLMAILERTHEIGMLMAIGMSKGKVFLMIMYETVMLSVVGGATGLGISWLLVYATNQTGIDLSFFSEGLNAVGYDSVVYPILDSSFYFSVLFMVIIVSIFASFYPARKALKLKPAEAVRHQA